MYARGAVLVTAMMVVSCGGEDETETVAGAGGSTSACEAGEQPLDGGGCRPAGVPSDACGEGFHSDESGGCVAVLPAEACPPGTMAIPGETACRAVATCGTDRWGDIPVDANTEFVDANYTAGDSDGSSVKPWPTIGAAFAAARSGAIIAVASGSYSGDVWLQFKPVRLWGRCPELVELTGVAVDDGTVIVTGGTTGTEIRDLSITGPGIGVIVAQAENVVVDRVWIHDVGNRGFNMQDNYGPASATVSRSLIEGAHEMGLYVGGGSASIERSVVRDTQPSDWGGRGIDIETLAERASVAMVSCLVERNRESGIFVGGSDATIEATLVRDTLQSSPQEAWGRGIVAQSNPEGTQRANVSIRSTVVERSSEIGLAVYASEMDVESTVVRDTQSGGATSGGYGINLSPDVPFYVLGAAEANIRTSLVSGSNGAGVVVGDSHALLEAVLVRNTGPLPSGAFGDGIATINDRILSTVSVTATRVETSARAGITNFGAQVSVGTTLFECNPIDMDGELAGDTPFVFDDSGGNRCGCGAETAACKVLSSNLEPPPPPAP